MGRHMPEGNQNQLIENRQFDKTLTIGDVSTPPSQGLFQPSYALSEADYLRLKQPSRILAGVGGVVLSFSLTYSLPKIVTSLNTSGGKSVPIEGPDLWISSISFTLGLGLIVVSYFFSGERRRVMKKIKKHFQENPGELEYRV